MHRFLLLLFFAALLAAETGHDAWLRYKPVPRARNAALPSTVVAPGESPVIAAARDELIRGVRGMLGRTLRIHDTPTESAIVLSMDAGLKPEAYEIATRGGHVVVAGGGERGVLYGVFALLRRMALHQPLEERSEPYAPVRWINQWDNLDGSIERGYGGRSIFFDNNNVREDLGPVRDYARLLASLGIHACAINNVNANSRVISTEFLPQVARVAEAFRPWGVRLALAIDFSSPKRAGGLDTFDPLDPRVAAWWQAKVDEIYRAVPDLAGFVLKADSEGRLGPSAYGRTHADAANAIARALKPHGGLIFYRGFVYDHRMDWRNLKNDRARAACDNFVPLDGRFEDNVVIQIKHGPIDFQVREPASPLFGALEKTNQAVELQITQEYFGQARHLVFLAPMWKEALDFDMHARGPGTPVKALVAGRVFDRPTGGFVGVANVGLDANWLGHHLSQANLYGYGRLAWNPDLTAEQIIDEWTRLTFSPEPLVVKTITAMQLASWRNYENYTGPLGAQTLTDITGNHYGPAVEASERNGWGQWHRADDKGIGMDRTVATGTGFIGQFRPAAAKVFKSLDTCPDELILFMHHVPYTHRLHSGTTVIQHIYDTHYEGAEAAARYVRPWRSLEGRIDEARYRDVLARLEYQAGHAQVWRDAVNTWFLKTSGIADAKGRVGSFPGRYEAEAMQLRGFTVTDVKPWEAASGAQAVACPGHSCSAALRFDGKPGWYDLSVRYFDQIDGVSRFRLFVNAQPIDQWDADDRIPTRRIDAHSSTRKLVRGVALRPGDTIRVEGAPQGGERAALDYIEVLADVPALKDVFKDDFLMGAALNRAHFTEQDAAGAALVKTHFNSITAENTLKWALIHPQPDTYAFEAADRFVEFGETNGMFIVGHTLVWHNQTPRWVFENATRDELLKRMRNHIHTVVGRYRGRIHGWDVVNEAVAEDGSMRQSPWLKIIGDDYIAKAFEYAHEADPKAELYYNDFALENEPKRRGALELIRKLQAQGIRIAGVGLQGHNNLVWPTVEQQEATIAAFAKLGVKVMITELDVDVLPAATRAQSAEITDRAEFQARLNPYVDGLPEEVQQALARRYAELFRVYRKHRGTVARVTFWGVTDRTSWKNNFPVRGRTNYPLLFDREGRPKPAFYAIVN